MSTDVVSNQLLSKYGNPNCQIQFYISKIFQFVVDNP